MLLYKIQFYVDEDAFNSDSQSCEELVKHLQQILNFKLGVNFNIVIDRDTGYVPVASSFNENCITWNLPDIVEFDSMYDVYEYCGMRHGITLAVISITSSQSIRFEIKTSNDPVVSLCIDGYCNERNFTSRYLPISFLKMDITSFKSVVSTEILNMLDSYCILR